MSVGRDHAVMYIGYKDKANGKRRLNFVTEEHRKLFLTVTVGQDDQQFTNACSYTARGKVLIMCVQEHPFEILDIKPESK